MILYQSTSFATTTCLAPKALNLAFVASWSASFPPFLLRVSLPSFTYGIVSDLFDFASAILLVIGDIRCSSARSAFWRRLERPYLLESTQAISMLGRDYWKTWTSSYIRRKSFDEAVQRWRWPKETVISSRSWHRSTPCKCAGSFLCWK